MKKIIVIFVGIALFIGVIVTGSYGLSQQNKGIYLKAIELEETADFGFRDFRLSDYNVVYYDGDNDYVLSSENGELITIKRKAVLNVFAATAYPVDGQYEVHVPTVEKMGSLMNMLSMGKAGYNVQEQVSTIWHEAFHCYQLTKYKNIVENIAKGDVSEKLISEFVDSSPDVLGKFTEQAKLLQASVNSDNVDDIREYMIKYKNIDAERKALLPEEINALEEFYIRIEGSACYIEACVYKMQKPQEFAHKYVEAISSCGGGSGKYYNTGMALCMILDKLNPDWKDGYDFSVSLSEMIYNELGL